MLQYIVVYDNKVMDSVLLLDAYQSTCYFWVSYS